MDTFYSTLLTIIIALIVLLFGRELVGWYFKFNKMVYLLEDIKESLKEMKEKMGVHVSENIDEESEASK